jgi:ribosomal protein S27E
MAHPSGQASALSCYACANRVWQPDTGIGEVHGTLPFPGLPAMTATVRGPVRTCNGCGRMQLLPSEGIRTDLVAALAAAIEAAGVRSTFR